MKWGAKMESMQTAAVRALLSDFLAQDDVHLLARDAGRLLNCPLLVLDDTFRVSAHYRTDGFADALFDGAVQTGQITYEAGAIISNSPLLTEGKPDYIQLADSDHRRRFAPLICSGVRLGYLICVDMDDHLRTIPEETYRVVEAVFAKQLFMEVSRCDDRPFETAEEVLMHLLDGGFASAAYFRLQTAGTYLANAHPAAFALIDLSAFHSMHPGKTGLRDALIYRFHDSHPFLYKGDVFLFLQKGYSAAELDALSRNLHLKAAISDPICDLYELPDLYRAAREALDLMTDDAFHGGSVYTVAQMKPLIALSKLRARADLIPDSIRAICACDRDRGSQYCETLYHYLCCGRSLKETCAAMFTHRNTILYRIHKMQDEFGVPVDDPDAHLELLLGTALALLRDRGADFFLNADAR